MVKKGELLYEGKAKRLYITDDETVLWVEYLNQATASNGLRKDMIQGKGELNNKITSLIFEALAKCGIRQHFVKKISETEQLIQKVEIIPLEVVLRNIAAGSFSKRLGVKEGKKLSFPIVEFYFKEDSLDDPFINDEHVLVLKIANREEIALLKAEICKVNEVLTELFHKAKIKLIDFKLEFGRLSDGSIILADEISPDTCRLWDLETNEHLDKDVYRREIGDLVSVYKEVLTRLLENEI
ncbi:MAG: phosphoribosylaminoimidazolesuccinocarboxamide synthase [Lactobacillales bacterium]|nr:phosphoribosylaminoimidazolesuccinocarboxamide synthase [Lactobacillales bacterium]